MSGHECQWFEAAECAGLRLAFFRANERVREPLRVLQQHLFMMCRAQFAAERSYLRFTEDESNRAEIETLLLQYLEAHAFLVSAKLVWDTLAGIKLALVTLKPPKKFIDEFKSASIRHVGVRTQLTAARDHIEHVAEQIREGRTAPYRDEGSAEVFRQALGRCEGTSLIFGSERFDLTEQLAALTDIRDRVAPSIASVISPPFAGAPATLPPPFDEPLAGG